jgi:hypothetical protein
VGRRGASLIWDSEAAQRHCPRCCARKDAQPSRHFVERDDSIRLAVMQYPLLGPAPGSACCQPHTFTHKARHFVVYLRCSSLVLQPHSGHSRLVDESLISRTDGPSTISGSVWTTGRRHDRVVSPSLGVPSLSVPPDTCTAAWSICRTWHGLVISNGDTKFLTVNTMVRFPGASTATRND